MFGVFQAILESYVVVLCSQGLHPQAITTNCWVVNTYCHFSTSETDVARVQVDALLLLTQLNNTKVLDKLEEPTEGTKHR